MANRTNINIYQPMTQGTEYGQQMYIDDDKSYAEQMRAVTTAAIQNKGVMAESEYVKTYQSDDYGKAEYMFPILDWDWSWDMYPWDFVFSLDFPDFDWDWDVVLPHVELDAEEEEVEEEIGTIYEIPIILGNSPVYDGSVDWPYQPWATVLNAAAGNIPIGGADCTAWIFYNGFWWNIGRGFCTFDLSGAVGAIAEARIESSVNLNAVYSIQEGTQNDPVVNADYNNFRGGSFAKNTAGSYLFELNSAGIQYLTSVIGSTAKFCFRNYAHDFLNAAPGSINESDELLPNSKLIITMYP
ncbi:hypothetical protein LCGC14_0814220 [marine sediment metagenome]|uniref:Uncharacterized protein n=1 Tax=marine sediment metagenome TaxID=412755 RepID=A0A0F9PQB9_9ZZZZ